MKFAVEMPPNDQQPSGLRSPAGAEANFMEIIRILDPNCLFFWENQGSPATPGPQLSPIPGLNGCIYLSIYINIYILYMYIYIYTVYTEYIIIL